MAKIWTEEEEQVLQDRYLDDGPTILADFLDRTKHSVQRKAFYMGLTHREPGQRTVAEIAQLRKIHEADKHKSRLQSPEYHEKRKAIVLKSGRKRREQRRANGICIHCDKPSLEYSAQFCLLHWACSIGSSCKNQTRSFAEKLIAKLKEQEYKCAITDDILIPGLNASIDHIIPKCRGGSNDIDNLQWVTEISNRSKWEMTTEEYISHCRKVVDHHDSSSCRNLKS